MGPDNELCMINGMTYFKKCFPIQGDLTNVFIFPSFIPDKRSVGVQFHYGPIGQGDLFPFAETSMVFYFAIENASREQQKGQHNNARSNGSNKPEIDWFQWIQLPGIYPCS